MEKETKPGKKKTWLLPAVAAVLAAAALCVVLFIPKNTGSGKNETVPAGEASEDGAFQTPDAVSEINEEGKLVIYADRLSSEDVSFIRISGDSRIELLARSGDDGTVKAALGTCQSCNGSPGAYYTQEGDQLKCNNCGLTFPISVLDSPGGGCHPIMINEEILQYQGKDLVIDLEGLSEYEPLFARVADH